MKEEFCPQSDQTNVYLAAFTPAHTRLKLYREIEKLREAVLYYDTDSIIYASNGINDPEIVDFLGDFTEELEGDVIVKFVSGGAKNYAYVTKSGKSVCKIRGFSLNYENSLKLNFDSLKTCQVV
ncbi:hypothetical protein AVEN_34421-1 [Araneus ventricosus]|uniref:Uncharacterized protein n=1 Tax=Araneus ventricosus TaxID=182803 RepID=A0A4Y2G3C0_ARAVE|nr:hypothetical protein AVEN_34421-1 [Araneus ventricosus]